MEKFWAVILIFVVVAAAGLMYVNQVYNPQKDSQMAMADTANQTLSAVKSDVEDTAPTTVSALNVVNTVKMYCKEGNTIEISVDGTKYINSTNNIEEKVDFSKYYVKKVIKDNDVMESIEFDEIE